MQLPEAVPARGGDRLGLLAQAGHLALARNGVWLAEVSGRLVSV